MITFLRMCPPNGLAPLVPRIKRGVLCRVATRPANYALEPMLARSSIFAVTNNVSAPIFQPSQS